MTSEFCRICESVVIKQTNFMSCWTFDLQNDLQILKLITVQLGVDCGVRRKKLEIDYVLKIPPNWQHNLFWEQVGFLPGIWKLSTIDPLTLAYMVNIEEPLLVISDDLLEKSVSIPFQQQRVADGDPLLDVVWCQLV